MMFINCKEGTNFNPLYTIMTIISSRMRLENACLRKQGYFVYCTCISRWFEKKENKVKNENNKKKKRKKTSEPKIKDSI